MAGHFDLLGRAIPRFRGAGCSRRCRRSSPTPRRMPRVQPTPARCRSRDGDFANGACPLAGHTQVRTRRVAEGRTPLRRIFDERVGQRQAADAAGLRVARPLARTGRQRSRLLATRAAAIRRRIPRGRSCAQLFLVSLHTRRGNARKRRAAWAHRVSRRHRPNEQQVQAMVSCGGRLCRHAFVPENHSRKSRRAARRAPEPAKSARFR